MNYVDGFAMIREGIFSPYNTGLPAENAAKKAAACPGVTAVATATATTPAIARYDVGVEAVISAARGAAMITRPVAAAAHFHGGGGCFERFGGVSGNGKSTA